MDQVYHVDQLPLFSADSIPQKHPRSKDKAYHAQRAREWRATHKEDVSRYNEAYAEANKERLIQYRKTRYEANKELLNKRNNEQYKKHQEKRRQSAKEYRETHPEQMKAYQQTPKYKEHRRMVNLAKRYGMSIEEWNALYQQQHGCCPICNKPLNRNGNRNTVVDHCHKTGTVRGLLCGKCNYGIGMLGDSPDAALRAYQYLSPWKLDVQEQK